MKIVRTLAITAVLGSFAALGTIPAQAATGYNRCPANRFCVFTGLNGSGVIAIYTKSDANLGDASGPRGMNNNIESGWNRRSSEWAVMNNPNSWEGGGTMFKVGEKGNLPTNNRNKGSSVWDIRAS
ncbi:peptidase inhibitor family I36 protein [Kribbella sp. NPDC055071]